MKRQSRLAAMRARRARDEAVLAAPHIAAADLAIRAAESERRVRIDLERAIRSELLPHALREIGHKLSDHVHREIMKAVMAQRAFSGTTKLELPTGMLLGADPKSVVAGIVEWWRSETAPNMAIRALDGQIDDRGGTMIEIRLPAMGYRHALWERH